MDNPELFIKPSDMERAEAQLSIQRTQHFARFKCPIHDKSADISVRIDLASRQVHEDIRGCCCQDFRDFIAKTVKEESEKFPLTVTLSQPK